MATAPILETPRLTLRDPRVADAAALQAKFPHWEIVQYLGAQVPWPYPPDGAEAFLRSLQNEDAVEDFTWAICSKEAPDDLIGMIALRPYDPETRTQRGFWIAREHWGQRLVTEASDRILDFAFHELGWSELWTGNARANIASSRIKARQGFALIEIDEFAFVSGVLEREVWRIKAEDWRVR